MDSDELQRQRAANDEALARQRARTIFTETVDEIAAIRDMPYDTATGIDAGMIEAKVAELLHKLQATSAFNLDALQGLRDAAWLAPTQLRKTAAAAARASTPAEEVKKHLDGFVLWQYESRLIDLTQDLLAPGEKIVAVQPFKVVTDKRELLRSELIASCRTPAETNQGHFDAQFKDDAQVNRIVERVEAQNAGDVPFYGRNLDFGPSGIRPGR